MTSTRFSMFKQTDEHRIKQTTNKGKGNTPSPPQINKLTNKTQGIRQTHKDTNQPKDGLTFTNDRGITRVRAVAAEEGSGRAVQQTTFSASATAAHSVQYDIACALSEECTAYCYSIFTENKFSGLILFCLFARLVGWLTD